MNNKRVKTKAMAMAVAAAMAVDLCPVTAFAVTGEQVAADGTYKSGTTHVTRIAGVDDEDEWDEYDISVDFTVKDGIFQNITVNKGEGYNSGNDSYFGKAAEKTKGMKTVLEGKPATEASINSWDTVTGATRTSKAIKEAALEAIHTAPETSGSTPDPVQIDTTKLQESIGAANEKAKNKDSYTEESWNAVETKLAAAIKILTEKTSQEAVDTAQKELDAAVNALKKKANTAPAKYNNNKETPALVKGDQDTDEDFQTYLKAVTGVKVNDKQYSMSEIIDTDGSIKKDAAVFKEGTEFKLVVEATGYEDLQITYVKEAVEEGYKYVYAALSYQEY